MSDKFGAEEFQELCRSEFHFLKDDYGFVEPELSKEEITNRNPFEVDYVSPTTSVLVIGVSYGHGLDVIFGPTSPESRKYPPRYVLEELLQIRRPDLSLEDTVGKLSRPDQPAQIRHYARALKEAADDVLRGDFSIASQLEDIIETRRKQLRWLYLREWLKDWKLSFQGCMARWRRARARH